MKKTLIIRSDVDLFLDKYQNVDRYFLCSVHNPILRVFRKFKFPLYFFLGKWKRNVKNYSTFILFDNGYTEYISYFIKKKNPNSRIIFWYWNSLVESKGNIISKPESIDEVWTYNLKDANKNNWNYNTQFYSRKMLLPKSSNEYDILFVGADKGREQRLKEFEKKLNEMNIKTCIIIPKKKSEYISYKQYIEMLSKSNCILDFSISNDESGLSLRVMESIFFEKKLITNNINVKEYDFYNPNNIFIVGIDEEKELVNFIKSKYKKINNEIIEKYDFDSWLGRFEKR